MLLNRCAAGSVVWIAKRFVRALHDGPGLVVREVNHHFSNLIEETISLIRQLWRSREVQRTQSTDFR